MIGRGPALEVLFAGLEAARGGDPALVVVRGDAGIGKTRLISEFLSAAADVRALHGGCAGPGARRLPFSPLVQAFTVEAGPEAGSRSGSAAGSGLAAVAARLGVGLPTSKAGSGGGRTALFEEVGAAFRQLPTDPPTVLVIEDLHWADLSTLDLLGFLVRRAGPAHAVIVTSVRSDEPQAGTGVTEWLADVLRLDLTSLVDLSPLTQQELGELAQHMRGEVQPLALVESLALQSGGNPYVAGELLKAADPRAHRSTSSTAAVSAVVQLRVAALTPPARELAELVAVAGEGMTTAALARVTAGSPPTDLLDELTEGGVLVAGGARGEEYSFPHELARRVVYEGIPEHRRRALHGRHAAALTVQAPSPGVEGALVRSAIAEHWWQADDDVRALGSAVDCPTGVRPGPCVRRGRGPR